METEQAVSTAVEIARPANDVALSSQGEVSQMLTKIASIVLDPSIEIARVELMLKLQKELIEDQRRLLFVHAKSQMTPRLPTISQTGEVVMYSKPDRDYAEKNKGEYPPGAQPMMKRSYAKQEDIIEAVRDQLGEFGFTLGFKPGRTEGGRLTMLARLSHVGGYFEEVDMPSVEVDATGGKNNIQGVLSSQKYLMRGATILLLNIVSRAPQDGRDDDGANSAAIEGEAVEVINEAQLKAIQAETKAQGAAASVAILKEYKIASLTELPAVKFQEVMDRLSARKAALAQARKAGK